MTATVLPLSPSRRVCLLFSLPCAYFPLRNHHHPLFAHQVARRAHQPPRLPGSRLADQMASAVQIDRSHRLSRPRLSGPSGHRRHTAPRQGARCHAIDGRTSHKKQYTRALHHEKPPLGIRAVTHTLGAISAQGPGARLHTTPPHMPPMMSHHLKPLRSPEQRVPWWPKGLLAQSCDDKPRT